MTQHAAEGYSRPATRPLDPARQRRLRYFDTVLTYGTHLVIFAA